MQGYKDCEIISAAALWTLLANFQMASSGSEAVERTAEQTSSAEGAAGPSGVSATAEDVPTVILVIGAHDPFSPDEIINTLLRHELWICWHASWGAQQEARCSAKHVTCMFACWRVDRGNPEANCAWP